MKNRIFKVMAVILAAIFAFGAVSVSAAPSLVRVNKDYRNMDILNRQGVKVNKPTAQFAANRIVNGEVADMAISSIDYDCNTEFPTLVCYVGDTLTFTDMSRDNNGGKIAQWDWQRFGAMGEKYAVYNRNIVNEDTYTLTEPGETTFYLCVKSDTRVKAGCCDPWSENGNHQVVGKNKWFPQGAYWYFTAVRVVVKPIREAIVHVRYWDGLNGTVFYENTVNAGQLIDDAQTAETWVNIGDWDGYEYSGWNVQLMDGSIQYSGTERNVGVILAGWMPEKYLNVEFFPYVQTGVEVRYWDKAENTLISSETLTGESVVRDKESKITVNIKTPDGYKTNGWNVQLTDGTIQYEGVENPTDIILNTYLPRKILNVKCFPLNNKKITVNYINSETSNVIKTSVIKPNQEDEEAITTEVNFENVPGYVIEDWKLKMPDGTVEQTGTEEPVSVTLTDTNPHKILDVNCFPLSFGGGGDPTTHPDPVTPPAPTPTVTVVPSGVCDGIIEWTETDSHRVIIGYRKNQRPIYGWCNHTFKYKSVLGATADISPETLKSGYGFGVDVNCTLNTTMVSNTGCESWGDDREHSATVKNPTTATVFVPWDMSNSLGSQGRSISMVPNGTLKFTLPESPVSKIGARNIYTPVELAGTKESPQSHSFEIYIGGGGVDDVEFCQKLDGTITINGDMYEDDFSGAN